MKTGTNLFFGLLVAILFQAGSAIAQEKISLRSAKFVSPLLEKWVAEYAKVNPQVQFSLIDAKMDNADVDINIFNPSNTANSVVIGRYAILPIAAKNNAILAELEKKKLNSKRLKELYFEPDEADEDYEPGKESKYNATVYAGSSQHSIAKAFAWHFGYETNALKGKKIAGDDIFVNHAIQKDNSGVSFNNLSYIFDLNSRRLKEEISILPLDLKKEYGEIFAESNLDKVIELLENKKIDLIPVEELVVEVKDASNAEIQKFLQWVRTEGQSFNHQLGFLKAESKSLAQK